MIEAVLMLAGTRPEKVSVRGCAFEFTDWELLLQFDNGGGLQTPAIVGSSLVLGTVAIPSNKSGSLTNTVGPCYLFVPPPPHPHTHSLPHPKFPDMKNLKYLTLLPTVLMQDKLPGKML